MPKKLLSFCTNVTFFLCGVTAWAENASTQKPDLDSPQQACVILLHGLARTKDSMNKLYDTLIDDGYRVVNRGYKSRTADIEKLAKFALDEGLRACNAKTPVHIVTHSLGGILVRTYLTKHRIEDLGRVVMLGPPNQGSEVVDQLGDFPGFELINGPAGKQLGTDDSSLPKTLGPVNFDLGVIAGDRSINLVLSKILPGEDDGKVSVESTKVEGMRDHITMHVTHTFMMKNPNVIKQVQHYLKRGRFKRG